MNTNNNNNMNMNNSGGSVHNNNITNKDMFGLELVKNLGMKIG